MSGESAIPAVEAALIAHLGEKLEGVPVVVGKPEPLPREVICVWEAVSETQYASLGQQRLDEVITILLFVEALLGGKAFEPSRDRAQEIASAVERRFREDVSLSDAWRFGRIAKRQQQYFTTDKNRGCRVVLTLTGKART